MYADFAEIFKRIFGLDWPALGILKTFGFLVALSFFAAAYTLYLELKRKEEDGVISGQIKEVLVGGKVSPLEYLINAVIGFVLGFKVVGMFINHKIAAPDPIKYVVSMQGSWIAGIVGALLFALIRYTEKNKYGIDTNSETPVLKKIKIPHYQRVGDLALIAAVSGFAGAKIFNAFEEWDYFISNPIDSIFSSSGFTFYGGLILATAALYFYTRSWKLSFKQLCDAAAPGLILAYGIGRLGCQVSGDGDWGVFNSAYVTTIDGKSALAQDTTSFQTAQAQYPEFFAKKLDAKGRIPHIKFPRPAALSFLPHSLFAYPYTHNVNKDGVMLADCKGSSYCTTLPIPVFPTPLYEFVSCLLIFGILWAVRKRLKIPLKLFGLYLIFNGLERFLVEKIRVNNQIEWLPLQPTQAEVISLSLFLIGLILFFIYPRFYKPSSLTIN